MAYAKGKYAQAISDRSGMAFPYNEMVREWNGMLVHKSDIACAYFPLAYAIIYSGNNFSELYKCLLQIRLLLGHVPVHLHTTISFVVLFVD